MSLRLAGELILGQYAAESDFGIGPRPNSELGHDWSRRRYAVKRRDLLAGTLPSFNEVHRRAWLASRHPIVVVDETHGTLHDRGPDERGLGQVDDGRLAACRRRIAACGQRSGHEHTEREESADEDADRKSTRLNSSHIQKSRMPSSA